MRSPEARRTPRIDFASAAWQRNEFGVDMLWLSRDPGNGAVTFALRTPADFHYPERQHFYDCEEELFQLEGDFRHDRVRPYGAGDYVHRPVGTVYGDDEGSERGGITLASLAREMHRHHFDDHPRPWTGHYLVDQRWNPRLEQPYVLSSDTLPWQPRGDDARVSLRRTCAHRRRTLASRLLPVRWARRPVRGRAGAGTLLPVLPAHRRILKGKVRPQRGRITGHW